MPVREMTKQEVKDWLGSGIVMPSPRPLPILIEQSTAVKPSMDAAAAEEEACDTAALRTLKCSPSLE